MSKTISSKLQKCNTQFRTPSSLFFSLHRAPCITKWTMLLQLETSTAAHAKIILAFALAALLFWLFCIVFSQKRSPYPLPPGPPGKWLVGNLGQLSAQPEQDYIRWGKEYSQSPRELQPYKMRNGLTHYSRLRGHSCQGARSAHDMLEHRQGRHGLA